MVSTLFFLQIFHCLAYAKPANLHDVNMQMAEERLIAKYKKAEVLYPPSATALVFLKDKKELLLYSGPSEKKLKLVHRFPVLAASGKEGPKLKEGDEQVPEGIYKITNLNPKSQYHLSLRVSYPNDFDKEQAKKENRTNLGGDIMIHGEAVSIGCIAIGNVAIEEIFHLAEKTDFKNWNVILSPSDFRIHPLNTDKNRPLWIHKLYESIQENLLHIPS